MKCPICGSSLDKKAKNGYRRVMDGNQLYECNGRVTHEFWCNPRSYKWYHYNADGVSETNFQYSRRWELDYLMDAWTEHPKENPLTDPKRSTFTIDSTGFDVNVLRDLIHKAEGRSKQDGCSVAHILAQALEAYFN